MVYGEVAVASSGDIQLSFKKYPLVKVTWNDAASTQSWLDPEDFDKPEFYKVDSYGLMIVNDSERVVVALSRSETTGRIYCVMEIPKGMVVNIEILRKKE